MRIGSGIWKQSAVIMMMMMLLNNLKKEDLAARLRARIKTFYHFASDDGCRG